MVETDVEMDELRQSLIRYIRHKFFSRSAIAEVAEDIVNEAFASVLPMKDQEKLNFGYLSMACVRIAYRMFQRMDTDGKIFNSYDAIGDLVDEKTVIDEIMESSDAASILNSLEVLRQIERIIILQRYYGDYSFAEIAKVNGLKLNTVLSHHRRALEKLRPRLSEFASDRSKRPPVRDRTPLDGVFSRHFND